MKEKSNGWICITRGITEHETFDKDRVNKFQAWVEMLLLANWCDVEIMRGGKKEICPRGSFPTTVRALQRRWKWSLGRITRFLKWCERSKMIKVERGTERSCSIITIVNYSKYQDQRSELRNAKRNAENLTDRYISNNTVLNTNKNTTAAANFSKSEPPEGEISYSDLVWKFTPTEDQLKSWRIAYPKVDIEGQLNRAKAWLLANSKNKKNDFPSFFNYWLNRVSTQKVEGSRPMVKERLIRIPGTNTCVGDNPYAMRTK